MVGRRRRRRRRRAPSPRAGRRGPRRRCRGSRRTGSARDRPRSCRRSRDDHHAEGQHPDEQEPDRAVRREPRALGHEADAADHHARPGRRPDDAWYPEQQGDRDAWQDAVGERVADEREPAQDDERADDRAGDRDEDAGRRARSRNSLWTNGSTNGPRGPSLPGRVNTGPPPARSCPRRSLLQAVSHQLADIGQEREVAAVGWQGVGRQLDDLCASVLADRLGDGRRPSRAR